MLSDGHVSQVMQVLSVREAHLLKYVTLVVESIAAEKPYNSVFLISHFVFFVYILQVYSFFFLEVCNFTRICFGVDSYGSVFPGTLCSLSIHNLKSFFRSIFLNYSF